MADGGNGARRRFQREGHAAIDWQGIEASPEFQELVRRRRGFVVRATIAFLGVFLVYLGLAAFATDFMGTQIVDGLPVAWLAAMAQVLLTWAVTWAYLRRADREFEPLERRAAEAARKRVDDAGAGEPTSERSVR